MINQAQISETNPQAAEHLWVDPSLLRAGDLIFRKGDGLTSRAVLALDPDPGYSHVGIVYMEEGSPVVIHAVPGPGDSSTPVKRERLATFADRRFAQTLTIRRINDVRTAEKAAQAAHRYHASQILFDADFDLASTDRMYCTELVWRAYQEGGLDLIGGHFDLLRAPFHSGSYILPSSVLNSPHLVEILTVPIVEKGDP